jgi:hypothetical protein
MRAGEVLRRVRQVVGLSQRALAERAGTTQSAVAAYESGAKQPSVATLDRIVRAAGLRLDWSVEAAVSPLADAAAGIREALAGGDEAEALRHVAEFVTALERVREPARIAAILADEPSGVGDRRWDALLAGVTEWAARRAGVRTPAWTRQAERFLDQWWFVTPYRSLHASVFVETPAELANRGVFLSESSLASV